MTLRIVQLGTPRLRHEGTWIGTVRRPPRGVRKERYARDDWFDVWLPDLSPSPELVARALATETAKQWKAFERAFCSEMSRPTPRQLLDLFAALSHKSNVSIGCYCEDEARCHRSVLRALLKERGATIA